LPLGEAGAAESEQCDYEEESHRDAETLGHGAGETGRSGDGGTGRKGDGEMGRSTASAVRPPSLRKGFASPQKRKRLEALTPP